MGARIARRSATTVRPVESEGLPGSTAWVLGDPRFALFCRYFAPLLASDPQAYRGRVATYAERDDGLAWRTIDSRRDVDLRLALAEHLAAGATGELFTILHGAKHVSAVGLASASPGDPALVLQLDLDGGKGYEPATIISALLRAFGSRFLVTSGSGRLGRYRVLCRVDEAGYTVATLRVAAVRQLQAIGYPPKKGGLEVYPARSNNRVPFGRGGCLVYDPSDLTLAPVQLHPFVLIDRLRTLPSVDVDHPSIVPTLPRAPAGVLSLDAANDGVAPAQRRQGAAPAIRPVSDQAAGAAAAQRYWRDGAGQGERDAVLTALVCDCFYRGDPAPVAVAKIEAWIQRGGLARTRGARLERGKAWELADVARRVRAIYTTYPHPGPAAPVHLSLREARTVVEIARAAAFDRGETAAAVGALLWAALPRFKGAVRMRRRGAIVRIHSDDWQTWGGKQYARTRAASGLFVPATGYLTAAACRRDGKDPRDAHAKGWLTSFEFDDATLLAPRRPIGTSYPAVVRAVLAADARVNVRGKAR